MTLIEHFINYCFSQSFLSKWKICSPECIKAYLVIRDLSVQKSPQTESCTDSGAENEGSCHSDQMSNDFSTDDGVDEGICLDNASSAERVLKPKVTSRSFSTQVLWNNCVGEKMNMPFLSALQSSLTFELFSVMVHSGSAAGGHYYACIKSFSDSQWYSFNDQHVSKVSVYLYLSRNPLINPYIHMYNAYS